MMLSYSGVDSDFFQESNDIHFRTILSTCISNLRKTPPPLCDDRRLFL